MDGISAASRAREHCGTIFLLVFLVGTQLAARADTLEAARGGNEIDPAVVAATDRQSILIDIRDSDEFRQAHIPGAINIPRAWLEFDLDDIEAFEGLTDAERRQQPIVLYCARGFRSAAAAEALRGIGYSDVSTIAGGFEAWRSRDLPIATGD